MCNTGCPYETHSGVCKGRNAFTKQRVQPWCMDKEDYAAFVESQEDDRILAYDLDRAERGYC